MRLQGGRTNALTHTCTSSQTSQTCYTVSRTPERNACITNVERSPLHASGSTHHGRCVQSVPRMHSIACIINMEWRHTHTHRIASNVSSVCRARARCACSSSSKLSASVLRDESCPETSAFFFFPRHVVDASSRAHTCNGVDIMVLELPSRHTRRNTHIRPQTKHNLDSSWV